MIFEMRLKSEPFQKIASGEKTVELRLFDDKRRGLNIGDDIIFTNLDRLKTCSPRFLLQGAEI